MPETIASLPDTLRHDLVKTIGAAHVLVDEETRAFFSQDIGRAADVPAAAVVQPGTVEELCAVVASTTGAGFAVIPRGGGASYTGGYLPERPNAVIVDTRRLARVTTISPDDMYVTVECGTTWKGMADALRPSGLRTPFWGPLSGAFATIGGSLSQNSILWGSARYGVSADSVLSLDVVLADGTLLRTGSAAVRTSSPYFRYYGPDLTGLFLGDTGALGIKARATMRLMRLPAAVQTASFSFETHDDLVGAMAEIAREGIASECFGMDPSLQRQRMKRASLAKDLNALKGVVTSARNLAEGVKEAAKVALAGRRFLDNVPYSMHVCTEARDQAGADAALRDIRRIAAERRGREVENTIPKVMRGEPFMGMLSGIGPEGERWLPVHAVLPLSQAAATWSAVKALLERHTDAFARHGIVVGVLTAIVAPSAFVLEPVFYWPAPRTLYYEKVFDRATLARFTDFPPNPEGEALVFDVRGKLKELFLQRGATHLQIGKTYPYHEGLRPEAWALVNAVKNAVDPRHLVNPGSLGLA